MLPLPLPIVLRVLDADGEPVRGVSVALAAVAGGGALTAATATTDENGQVHAHWTLGPDVGSQSASATAGSLPTVMLTANANPPFNLLIESLHVTQAVQTLDRSVPLVSGRDGLLRVFVRSNDAARRVSPSVRVRIYHGELLVDTVTIAAPASAVPVQIDEQALGGSWNYRIPGILIKPGLRIAVEVDPQNEIGDAETDNIFPRSGVPLQLVVRNVPPFRARFVPITLPDGTTGDITVHNKSDYIQFAELVLPFDSIDVDVRSPYNFDKVLPASNDSVWSRLLHEIELLRRADASTRHYFGVVKSPPSAQNGGLAYYAGHARAAIGIDLTSPYGDPGLPYRAMVVAHEWAHNLDRRHVDCGGPFDTDRSYPHPGGRIGSFGWNHRTNTLVSSSTYDFMSYCRPIWTSGYTYKGILDFYLTYIAESPGITEQTLLVWGRSTPNGDVVLEPAFQVSAQPSLPRPGRRFRLQASDADGRKVFDMSFDGEEVDHLGVRHFTFAIPRSMLGGRDVATLRLTAGTAHAVRSAPKMDAGPGGNEVSATRLADGRVRLRWDRTTAPVIIVRDAHTGEILSVARDGDSTIRAEINELDLDISNGVGSWSRRITVR